jgi:phosphoglycerol transferase MdoB-like AlkP superfamily enzyme
VRASSLVAVLVLARVFGLAGRDLPLSIWTPSALLWHDVAVGVVFWLCERLFGWSWPLRILFWALVGWAAVNVAVVRALSSPLTLPMLRAAGGPLSDSIGHYATPANAAMIAAVLAAGWYLPTLRPPERVGRWFVAVVIALALPGPFVESQVDTRGAQQNAATALLGSALRQAPDGSVAAGVDLRASPFSSPAGADLRALAGAAAGRNVVLIVLESTGARHLRSYGATDDPMPTLTALAREAILFESAYAVYPESIKGLFALLCSRHPALDVDVLVHAAAACAPLARVLSDAGYRTALFHSGRFSYLGMRAIVDAQAFHTSEDAGAIGGQVESSFGVDEPSAVARILSWIDGLDRTGPFFVTYLPVAGHHPYAIPVPGPFSGQSDVIAYKNALWYADRSIAVLLEGLRSRGLDRRTMVVIVGDHGEAFGEHDGNFGHTLFAFDENVRVPLLVSAAGVTTGAIKARQVASVVDIAPTVLDLLGLAVPDAYEGASLLPGVPRLAFVFTDYALRWVGLRDGCWKYLLEIDPDRSQLYDVCLDPGETSNRASEHPERVRAYGQRARAWIAAHRQAYQIPSPAARP